MTPRIIYYAFLWPASQVERDVVSQAMAYWEEETDGEVYFFERHADTEAGYDLALFTATAAELEGMEFAFHWNTPDGPDEIDFGPKWFKSRAFQRIRQENVVRHELGHFLGYKHSKNPFSVMHPWSANLIWRAGI